MPGLLPGVQIGAAAQAPLSTSTAALGPDTFAMSPAVPCILQTGPSIPFLARGNVFASPATAGAKDSMFNQRVIDDLILQSMRNKYDFYEDGHPLAVYVNRLAARLRNGKARPRIYLTKSWDEINACALSNGAIIMSDRILKFCQYEEELEFIIEHEFQHAIREHFARRTKVLEKLWREKRLETKDFLEDIGQGRIFEYESDLRAVVDMSGRGVNPYGGIVFFGRLQGLRGSKDLAHGSGLDRALNIGMVTRLYDLAVLTQELKTLPEEINSSAIVPGQSDYQLLVSEGVDEFGKMNFERHDCAKRACFQVLMEALLVVAARISRLEDSNAEGHFNRMRLDEDRAVLNTMLGRIKCHIDSEFAALPQAARTNILAIALMAGAKVDLTQVHGDADTLCRIADEFAEGFDSAADFQGLEKVLTPLVFERLGLFFVSEPESFIGSIVRMALETDMFNHSRGGFDRRGYFEFCLEWIDLVDSLSMQRGIRRPDRREALMDLIFLALPNINRKEEMRAFLASATGLRIPLTAGDIDRAARERGVGLVPHRRRKKRKSEIESFFKALKGKSADEVRKAVSEIDFEDSFGFKEEVLARLIPRGPGILAEMSDIARFKWVLSLAGELGFSSPPGDWFDHNITAECAGDILDIHAIFERYFEESADPTRTSKDEFSSFLFRSLEAFVNSYSKTEFMAAFGDLADKIDFARLPRNAHRHEFLERLFSAYEFDLSRTDELKFLFQISFLIADPSLAVRFRGMLSDRLLKTIGRDEAFDFLFVDRHYRFGTSLMTKEEYVDARVNSLEDLEKLRGVAMEADTAPLNAKAGRFAVADVLERHLRGKKALFQIFMETRRDDRKLKETIYSHDEIFRYESGEESPARIAATAMMRTEQAMLSLYTLDAMAIHVLTRHLLVGDRGLLLNHSGRRWLVDYLFENLVREEPENAVIADTLRRGLNELMMVADVETLFFAVAPIVEARILKPPKKTAGWHDILKARMSKREAHAAIDAHGKAEYSRGLMSDLVEDDIVEEDTAKIHAGSYSMAIGKMIGGEGPKPGEEYVSPMGLVLEIASKLGSPGVRFLQILGQFVSVPGEYESEFARIYDGMRGQTKLTAYLLLKREWPELANEVAEIHATVGGGSLMTTFRVRTKDGQDEVVKVLNPNAEYHLHIVYGMLEQTIGRLAEKEGGGYRLAKAALADIRDWIARDITFGGFLDRDRVFCRRNSGFRPEGMRYSVMVPKSRGPNNKYFKREEYVEGTNLTQPERLAEEGHDLKEIAALLIANYWHQIGEGLVHSDVHPGNFRVTKDGRVAILDRNFFIELDERDRALVLGLVGSKGEPVKIARAVRDYFGLDEASALARSIERRISRSGGGGVDAMATVKDIVIYLKEGGVHVPLKITLLIKNLNGLANIARMAGFGGLMEAFAYSADRTR